MNYNTKTFSISLSTSGDLYSSFVFSDNSELGSWLAEELPILKSKYNITYKVEKLDVLKIGDKCHVTGDGLDVYTIKKVIKFSPYRYGFVLNTGFVEEVAKCYKVRRK